MHILSKQVLYQDASFSSINSSITQLHQSCENGNHRDKFSSHLVDFLSFLGEKWSKEGKKLHWSELASTSMFNEHEKPESFIVWIEPHIQHQLIHATKTNLSEGTKENAFIW